MWSSIAYLSLTGLLLPIIYVRCMSVNSVMTYEFMNSVLRVYGNGIKLPVGDKHLI